MRVMFLFSTCVCLLFSAASAEYVSESNRQVGTRKTAHSVLELNVGDKAPDFTLKAAVTGKEVSLSHYLGANNVVISFVPRAWDPVCSLQWPRYDAARQTFERHDAMLLGITADKVETTLGWIKHLCLGDTSFWFPILSDVSPRGAVAKKYGVLRSDGYSERAVFLIDKKGIIRYIDVHEQDSMPPFTVLVEELAKLKDS